MFEMQLKPSFLLAMLFIVISSSVVLDSSQAEEYEASLHNFREFFNPQQRTTKPRTSSSQDADGMRRNFEKMQQLSQRGCVCGLSSFKCCFKKTMLQEVKRIHRNFAGFRRDDIEH